MNLNSQSPALTMAAVRSNLSAFSKQWKNAARENADAKLFWARFYECFGIRPESSTIYEHSVKKLGGAQGFIDSFIPGLLLVEHKSKGKSLDSAFTQASEYVLALPEAERPRFIVVSDFARFRLYDLRTNTQAECTLANLSSKAHWFGFLMGQAPAEIEEESPINRQAAYAVSKLHEALLRAKFTGSDLEVLMTRLLFCFFADDTGIFGDNGIFRKLVEGTRADGKDTGSSLAALFDVLDTSEKDRQSSLDDSLAAFAYINGSLFTQRIRIPAFDTALRQMLVDCAVLDWSEISPAIFGAMFQGVLEEHKPDETRQVTRRELGAHYTSERNILRLINPLFMDDLRDELEAASRSKPRLQALYDKLPTLNFFDPACGCGNFLVIAYRELRRFENDVVEALFDTQSSKGLLDVSHYCRVRVSQFYGIEIEQAAVHIARVAMWITDHQMNLESAERFGNTRPTVPLVDSAAIVIGNALREDWSRVIEPSKCSYILGNPPFIGKAYQTIEQKEDLALVYGQQKNKGVLDYVAAWYVKAVDYIKRNSQIEVAFVSTNSITQGEQVAVLWPKLLQDGIHLRFAHRSFKWSNEGKGNAAVHCVILGFGLSAPKICKIWDYTADIKGDGKEQASKRINPYLVDAADVCLEKRRSSLCNAPEMNYGSMPNDGGFLLLSKSEKDELISKEPQAEKWIKRFSMGDEFINGIVKFCLWLPECSPAMLRDMPLVMARVQAVRQTRLESTRATTQDLAAVSWCFGEIRQPQKKYLAVPRVSSEKRMFIPIDFLSEDHIAGDKIQTLPSASLYHFAVLTSTMHNAWMRAVCGRMKSDYSYSNTIVYNNFPWPELDDKKKTQLEKAGQAILDARALYPDSSLADLYDPLTMPTELRKAHQANDKAVDTAYGYSGDKSDAKRVAFLFDKYQQLTSLLPKEKSTKKRKLTKAQGDS